MALLGKLGFVVAAVGAAHFVVPEAFEEITAAAFPQDTQDWIQRNGITEVAVGTALMVPPTRKLGVLGLLGYAGWLGYNVTKNS